MQPHDTFRVLWIVWILYFVVVEWYGIANNIPGSTLTEFIRWLIGTHQSTDTRDWDRWAARIFFIGLLIWFVPHFLTGHSLPHFIERWFK